MPSRVLFTPALYAFLKQEGYTHMQFRGIEKKAEPGIHSPALPDDDFILVPWKKGLALFEEAHMQLEAIDSTEVTDMFGVEFGISFWVELPEEVALLYGDTKT